MEIKSLLQIVISFVAIALFISCNQENKNQKETDIEQKVEKLLKQLTLEEKISLLAGKDAIELPHH